jgi:hypothetical protein
MITTTTTGAGTAMMASGKLTRLEIDLNAVSCRRAHAVFSARRDCSDLADVDRRWTRG